LQRPKTWIKEAQRQVKIRDPQDRIYDEKDFDKLLGGWS
jgi:hypothetical protein